MNLDDITSILRRAFTTNPLPKSEPLEPQSGLILYRIASPGSASVILKKSAVQDGDELKWEIPQNIEEIQNLLITSKSQPLLKSLTENRIIKLNEDGSIGAIELEAVEADKIGSYMHRHWRSAAGINDAPNVGSFRLNDFLDFGLKRLSNPNQMDILAHFAVALKAREKTRELELILG